MAYVYVPPPPPITVPDPMWDGKTKLGFTLAGVLLCGMGAAALSSKLRDVKPQQGQQGQLALDDKATLHGFIGAAVGGVLGWRAALSVIASTPEAAKTMVIGGQPHYNNNYGRPPAPYIQFPPQQQTGRFNLTF